MIATYVFAFDSLLSAYRFVLRCDEQGIETWCDSYRVHVRAEKRAAAIVLAAPFRRSFDDRAGAVASPGERKTLLAADEPHLPARPYRAQRETVSWYEERQGRACYREDRLTRALKRAMADQHVAYHLLRDLENGGGGIPRHHHKKRAAAKRAAQTAYDRARERAAYLSALLRAACKVASRYGRAKERVGFYAPGGWSDKAA